MKAFISLLRVQGVLDGSLDHHVAEGEEHILVLADFSTQLGEIVVNLFFLRIDILDVKKVDPLEEITFQALLEHSRTQGVDY